MNISERIGKEKGRSILKLTLFRSISEYKDRREERN